MPETIKKNALSNTLFQCRLWLLAFIFTALVAGAFLSGTSLQADSGDIQAASRSVVRVAVFGEVDGERRMIGHGSGVVVAPDKIITNAHVVEESIYNETITFQIVPSQGSESYSAAVIKWSPENDLALLQLEKGARLVPASLLVGEVTDGSDVFAIGYPASVDIAMELDEGETMRPQPPVKTRGTVSAGRSAKAFDTILHTAPIAPGNSGGPMVDNCGRVVGINSFGSTNENGGSEFYFAISMRELTAFLRAQKVKYTSANGPCRSVAELTAAEEQREAAARAKIEAEARIADELRTTAEGKLRRDTEFAIMAERENRMALSFALLSLALLAAGISYAFFNSGRRLHGKVAGIGSGAIMLGAAIIFAGRPAYSEVDDRVRAAITDDDKDSTATDGAVSISGKKTCIIVPERSKVTVSNTADVSFDWKAGGCVNNRTQYAASGARWTRSFVPNNDAQVSIISFDPSAGSYRIERYLLGIDAMQKARTARQQFNVKGCSANEAARRKIANMNKAVRDVLPEQPNELLVFSCEG